MSCSSSRLTADKKMRGRRIKLAKKKKKVPGKAFVLSAPKVFGTLSFGSTEGLSCLQSVWIISPV